MKRIIYTCILCLFFSGLSGYAQSNAEKTFRIEKESFILNGKPFIVRCGEMHFARIPKEYWRHRLKMAKAMGLNTICAYLFWNLHEPEPGKFYWSNQADAAEFCKIAHEEGLYVLLRPGPYSCAEWEFGGFPWWLLKKKDIALRTQDAYYLECCQRYLKEVGHVLAPLQIDRGGPILMVQVENEYGSYGSDKEYIGKLKNYLKDAGFTVPLFTCDGPVQLKNDVRDDIFSVVNFGSNPESAFKALREVRPTGPLMCGEYYPGWFDGWGAPHHIGSSERVVNEVNWMLEHKASFSIYMVHGGTTFGLWAGANCPPYSPQTSSYDYDAPINEQGAVTPKFYDLRNVLKKYLLPGEMLTDVPSPLPVQSIAPFYFTEFSPILDQLQTPVVCDTTLAMEDLNQGYGAVVYETMLKAGAKGILDLTEVHDYALVYLENECMGTLDRRKSEHLLTLPLRRSNMRLRIFTEATGRVNYGNYIHDKKGLIGEVYFTENGKKQMLKSWKHYSVKLENNTSPVCKYALLKSMEKIKGPAFYKAVFTTDKQSDTYLDLRQFGKGVVWLNGRCLGRYWNIGPTQTMFTPGVWLHKGKNEVVVMDLYRPLSLTMQGLSQPILDSLTEKKRLSSHRSDKQKFIGDTSRLVFYGTFQNSADWQTFVFPTRKGRYLAIEVLNNFMNDPFASLAEVELLDQKNNTLNRDDWKVVYSDSEELEGEDGKADNLFDLQFTTIWHTQWQGNTPKYPHQVVIDLGRSVSVSGIKMLPRQNNQNGRIKDFKVYLSDQLFGGL